jgi:hypothetical protein
MPQRAAKMTGGPSGKKRGPGDLRSPEGPQFARLKRENTAKLPKGVTGVILGGKPGTHTVGGKKKVQITQKQMDALHTVKRSAEAGRKMIKRDPPKTSVRTWLKSKLAIGEPSFGLSKEERAKMGRQGKRLRSRDAAARSEARREKARGGSRR